MGNPIWHSPATATALTVDDVERIREAMRAALAPLSGLELKWLLVDSGRRMRELAEPALHIRDEAEALVAELAGAEREAEIAAAKLEEAQRELKAAAKQRDTRSLPYGEAQERLHVAETNAKAAADAVEVVRAALERRIVLTRA